MNHNRATRPLSLLAILALFLSAITAPLTANEPPQPDLSEPESMTYLPLIMHNTLPQLRQDIHTVTEFAALKQLYMLQVMETFTDGYTAGFMENELTFEQIDALLATQAELLVYEQSVSAALMRLENDLALTAGHTHSGQDAAISSLGGSLARFWNWASGSGQRSRERILTVVSNYSPAQREHLYNNALREGFQDLGSDSEEFWLKLQDGQLDTQAPQIFNDLYHLDAIGFGIDAQDRGLTIQKIVHREGAEGVEAGAELMVEVVKTATPLGQGMDLAEKGLEYIEKIEQCLENPVEFIKEEVKDAVIGELTGFVDIDGLVDAEFLGEMMGEAVKILTDATVSSENPDDWFAEVAGWGIGQVLDVSEQEVDSDLVVAVSTDSSQMLQVVISLLDMINNIGDKEIHIGLPAGEWGITAVTEDGNHDSVQVDIQDQENSVVVVNTDPDAEGPGTEFALSVWISPASPAPGQSVIVYARIIPAVANEAIYFSISGTDGYSNSETNFTNSDGMATFFIPGGGEGVVDTVTVQIVRTGQTRVITYSFR